MAILVKRKLARDGGGWHAARARARAMIGATSCSDDGGDGGGDGGDGGDGSGGGGDPPSVG